MGDVILLVIYIDRYLRLSSARYEVELFTTTIISGDGGAVHKGDDCVKLHSMFLTIMLSVG